MEGEANVRVGVNQPRAAQKAVTRTLHEGKYGCIIRWGGGGGEAWDMSPLFQIIGWPAHSPLCSYAYDMNVTQVIGLFTECSVYKTQNKFDTSIDMNIITRLSLQTILFCDESFNLLHNQKIFAAVHLYER